MKVRTASISIFTVLVGALVSVLAPTALAADGGLDTSFHATGWATTDFSGCNSAVVQALALQSDGKIVAAGSYFTGGQEAWGLSRYNTDGSLDASFDIDGKVTPLTRRCSSISRVLSAQCQG